MFGPFKRTRTLAELEISAAAYDEIALALIEAGYDHSFVGGAIGMHGIGLTRAAEPVKPAHRPVNIVKKGTAPGAIS